MINIIETFKEKNKIQIIFMFIYDANLFSKKVDTPIRVSG